MDRGGSRGNAGVRGGGSSSTGSKGEGGGRVSAYRALHYRYSVNIILSCWAGFSLYQKVRNALIHIIDWPCSSIFTGPAREGLADWEIHITRD